MNKISIAITIMSVFYAFTANAMMDKTKAEKVVSEYLNTFNNNDAVKLPTFVNSDFGTDVFKNKMVKYAQDERDVLLAYISDDYFNHTTVSGCDKKSMYNIDDQYSPISKIIKTEVHDDYVIVKVLKHDYKPTINDTNPVIYAYKVVNEHGNYKIEPSNPNYKDLNAMPWDSNTCWIEAYKYHSDASYAEFKIKVIKPTMHKGKVIENIKTKLFSYAKVITKGKSEWIYLDKKVTFKDGDLIEYEDSKYFKDYKVKEIDRTFDQLIQAEKVKIISK